MSKIKCPVCGHICNSRIEFGSHIRRCQAITGDRNFKFNRKKNSKKNSKKKKKK